RTKVLGARFVQLEKIVALMVSRLAGHSLRSQVAIKRFIFGMYLKKDVLLSQTKSFAETISCSEWLLVPMANWLLLRAVTALSPCGILTQLTIQSSMSR